MAHYLLHIDTSGNIGTVSVSDDGVILASVANDDNRNHAGMINNMISSVLETAGISFKSLTAVVVCGGPGSYTGLRIGMATAKALCYTLEIPLLVHNKLTLLAYQVYHNNKDKYEQYASLLLAREKEYFITAHDKNFSCTVAPQHILADALAELFNTRLYSLLVTDIQTDILNNLFPENIIADNRTEIDINAWSKYAIQEYECNRIVNLSNAEPFYLKQVYTHK